MYTGRCGKSHERDCVIYVIANCEGEGLSLSVESILSTTIARNKSHAAPTVE